ncbi:hypothetical protein AGLY_000141 [Aphis glycines]|uniref:Histone H4 n=1 Tax=Aphis glycines TaxID=307491 RepID=A0A6G0U7L6_APHGL|nr:hypothetical protein AGLY_000141 [Aphis glycines]
MEKEAQNVIVKCFGITKPAIRRLARRGGVKRISGMIYEETRGVIKYLHRKHAKRKIVTARDVVYALKRRGRYLVRFRSFDSGNCISLEDIDILHYSSADPIKTINSSSSNPNSDIIISEENINHVNELINDHDYLISTRNQFTVSFVVHKLTSTFHCDICLKSLCSVDKDSFLNSLITLKNRGVLKTKTSNYLRRHALVQDVDPHHGLR